MKITSTRCRSTPRLPRATSGTLAVMIALSLAGCGGQSAPQATGNAATPAAAAAPVANAAASDNANAATPPAQAVGGALAGHNGVLTNPNDSQMVFLYYDLAGIPPPLDQWVEQDQRVNNAPGAQKAEQRTLVKAEMQAGLAAVKDVGVLHLTTNAQLSQYDPTYGEFTLGALSPASEYTFKALGRQVSVKFDNGLDAQTWSVPKAQSQGIVDKIGYNNPTLDVALQITKVLPAPEGGTLVTHIVSWTLRDPASGATLAKITVTHK